MKSILRQPKELTYSLDALEPVISAKTMRVHYDQHYLKYIDTFNSINVDSYPLSLKKRNAKFQILHHEFFFDGLAPYTTDVLDIFPSDIMYDFEDAAINLFGSGYVCIILDNNQLGIEICRNAAITTTTPILSIDMWEHAYYLDYMNSRSEYVKNFWNIVNWNLVKQRLYENV